MQIDGGEKRARTPRRGRWSQAEKARLKELYGRRDDVVIARELNRPVASVKKMADKLFAIQHRSGPWTASEVGELKKYLGVATVDVIARILGRGVEEVRTEIFELGRILRDDEWRRDELVEFKRIYGTRTDEDLSRIFGRSMTQVQRLAEKHALSKDKAFVRKLSGQASTRMPRWTQAELESLRRDYLLRSNLELARELGRSVKSVVSKAHNLGLKKAPERLREMGRENVSLRYRDDEDSSPSAVLLPPPPPPPQPPRAISRRPVDDAPSHSDDGAAAS